MSQPAAIASRNLSSSSSTTEEEVELTQEDIEIALLYELEQTPEIACRYTEGDPDFAKEMTAPPVPPPIVTHWAGPRPFYGGRGGQGRGGGGGRGRWEGQGRGRWESQGQGRNGGGQQDRKRPYDDHDQGRNGGGGQQDRKRPHDDRDQERNSRYGHSRY